MKITYLKLKNFAAIDVTLHTKRLEIDFSKMVNPILLFIGPIGSCKTYILSQLQPFAYMGNVDLRHGEDMILPGKDGEKEIHYLKSNGDVYVIRHYYFAKKNGRQIRSYIEKNGIEMNTSGLVTSYSRIPRFNDLGVLDSPFFSARFLPPFIHESLVRFCLEQLDRAHLTYSI